MNIDDISAARERKAIWTRVLTAPGGCTVTKHSQELRTSIACDGQVERCVTGLPVVHGGHGLLNHYRPSIPVWQCNVAPSQVAELIGSLARLDVNSADFRLLIAGEEDPTRLTVTSGEESALLLLTHTATDSGFLAEVYEHLGVISDALDAVAPTMHPNPNREAWDGILGSAEEIEARKHEQARDVDIALAEMKKKMGM